MNKEIKILIIGFGSIGQRHYRNLQKLGLKEVYVYDVDKKQTDKPGVKSVSSLTEKVLKDFDVSFVCNPSSLHIKTAMLCARVGCHLFIEKPLSHNLRGIKKEIDNYGGLQYEISFWFEVYQKIYRWWKVGKYI